MNFSFWPFLWFGLPGRLLILLSQGWQDFLTKLRTKAGEKERRPLQPIQKQRRKRLPTISDLCPECAAIDPLFVTKKRYGLKARILKLARLQSEFCTKDFLELRIFLRRCSEVFPENFEPFFCGSEKISQNSRQVSHQISLR